MKLARHAFFALGIVLFSSCSVMNSLDLKPTNLETVSALKSILNSSTIQALSSLKNIRENGVSALLPSELERVLSTLKTLGYNEEIDQVLGSVEGVTKIMLDESEAIFKDAIKELSFKDAVSIVVGGEEAATSVFKANMYESVSNRYSARIEQELSKTDALKYWPIASTSYNLFAKNKIDDSLPDFIAKRSVDAIFLAMGKQESSIRADYPRLGNVVVNKVFDYYVKNKK